MTTNCASSNKVPETFRNKMYNIVDDFKKTHIAKTEIDKKFHNNISNKAGMDNTINYIYYFSKEAGIDENCIFNNFKSGLEQVYRCHNSLLEHIKKKHPEILKNHYNLNYKTNRFWNDKTKTCDKELTMEECNVYYKGETYYLNKNGKIYLMKKVFDS